jgi:aminomethyltransferase
MLKRTPFYDFHVSAGAKLVDFAGWEMPLLYRGILDEHEQTRRSGSIFDVSHMGRLTFSGKDAQNFLNRVLTRNVSDQVVGQSRYSLVCNESGGILDDIIISRDQKNWMMVCNASNREKLVGWFNQHLRLPRVDFGEAVRETQPARSSLLPVPPRLRPDAGKRLLQAHARRRC